jgi:hypothetical protein
MNRKRFKPESHHAERITSPADQTPGHHVWAVAELIDCSLNPATKQIRDGAFAGERIRNQLGDTRACFVTSRMVTCEFPGTLVFTMSVVPIRR